MVKIFFKVLYLMFVIRVLLLNVFECVSDFFIWGLYIVMIFFFLLNVLKVSLFLRYLFIVIKLGFSFSLNFKLWGVRWEVIILLRINNVLILCVVFWMVWRNFLLLGIYLFVFCMGFISIVVRLGVDLMVFIVRLMLLYWVIIIKLFLFMVLGVVLLLGKLNIVLW